MLPGSTSATSHLSSANSPNSIFTPFSSLVSFASLNRACAPIGASKKFVANPSPDTLIVLPSKPGIRAGACGTATPTARDASAIDGDGADDHHA